MTASHERLAAARLKAGFKNAFQAARANGWPPRSYLRHETGEVGFAHYAEKYAKAFGVTVKDLSGDGPRNGKNISGLVLIEPTDINAITEILRGLPPLPSNPESPRPLACGPRSFLMVNFDSELIPKGALMALDPDAAPNEGDLVLAHVPSRIQPILQRLRPHNESKFIAKLAFVVISLS